MSTGNPEKDMKKKLQAFLRDMLKIGSVKGFKYFSCYLRGREELILTIVNNMQRASYSSEPTSPEVRTETNDRLTASGFLHSDSATRDHRNPRNVSALIPASPYNQGGQSQDTSSTSFLLAGYARYNSPYVWVRADHDRLVQLTNDITSELDNPLKMKSTSRWSDYDIHVWDVIAELVKMCTHPSPLNPFAVNFSYFSTLSLSERVLATAGMCHCLQKILIQTKDEKLYAGKVFEELQVITKHHYEALRELVKQQRVPVLQQHFQGQTSSQQQRVQRSTYAAPSGHYSQQTQASKSYTSNKLAAGSRF